MYRIRRSIDIHFAHHIRGHLGSCINIHGHTWKLEVDVAASELDAQGFVIDFRTLKQKVLEPCYALLDHSLALGAESYAEAKEGLAEVGKHFLASRSKIHPKAETLSTPKDFEFQGAYTQHPGGMKVTVFPFSPTSERLAKWLFDAASQRLDDARVQVQTGRIYESLHPVQSVGEYHRA